MSYIAYAHFQSKPMVVLSNMAIKLPQGGNLGRRQDLLPIHLGEYKSIQLGDTYTVWKFGSFSFNSDALKIHVREFAAFKFTLNLTDRKIFDFPHCVPCESL